MKAISTLISLGTVVIFGCAGYKIPTHPTSYPMNRNLVDIRQNSLHVVHVKRVDPYIVFFDTEKYWTDEVSRFYRQRNCLPVWINSSEPNKNALDLIEAIDSAEFNALIKTDYNYLQIDLAKRNIETLKKEGIIMPSLLAKLDIMLTDAYIRYAFDLHLGQHNPILQDIKGEMLPKEFDPVRNLEEAVANNEIKRSLYNLEPQNVRFQRLKLALMELNEKKRNNTWDTPGDLPVLMPGDTNKYVVKIKEFLLTTGDLDTADHISGNPFVFDHRLEEAVRKFQKRHSLSVDGNVGEKTLAEMNVSVNYRIHQLKLNIERSRWMPDEPGERYILINIPEFRLDYFENGSLKSRMKVIVGKFEDETPLLHDTISYIEFNPTWNVPHSIASKVILPKIQSDPTYLERNDFEVRALSYNGIKMIPDSIDWDKYNEKSFPYRLVQKAGKMNALGNVKFIFPNKHYVYIHDTPSNYLFDRESRDLSHGCIRLENPIELADKLLNNSLYHNRDSTAKFLEQKETKRIYLREDISVYITYNTVRVHENGEMYFYKDIYNFDKLYYASSQYGIRLVPIPPHFEFAKKYIKTN